MDPKRKGRDSSADTSRRRVIKAVAGAPVILTLANGAAQANTSSFQCMANGAGDAPADPVIQDPGAGNPNPDWVWNTPPDTIQVPDPNDPNNMLTKEKWTLKRFVDNNGTVIETGNPSDTAVTVSCYASFA